jgi:hypothetical protein
MEDVTLKRGVQSETKMTAILENSGKTKKVK